MNLRLLFNFLFANTGIECFSPVKRVLLHSYVSILWCGWGNLYLVSALECLKSVFKKKKRNKNILIFYILDLFYSLARCQEPKQKPVYLWREVSGKRGSCRAFVHLFVLSEGFHASRISEFCCSCFMGMTSWLYWVCEMPADKKPGEHFKGFCKGATLRSSPSWPQSFAFGAWGSVCPVLFLWCLGRHKGWSSLCSTLAPRD